MAANGSSGREQPTATNPQLSKSSWAVMAAASSNGEGRQEPQGRKQNSWKLQRRPIQILARKGNDNVGGGGGEKKSTQQYDGVSFSASQDGNRNSPPGHLNDKNKNNKKKLPHHGSGKVDGSVSFKKSRKPKLGSVQLGDLAPKLSSAASSGRHSQPNNTTNHQGKQQGQEKKDGNRTISNETNDGNKISGWRPSTASTQAKSTRSAPWSSQLKKPPPSQQQQQHKQQQPNRDKSSPNKNTKAKDGVAFSLEDFPSLPVDASVGGGVLNPLAQPWTKPVADNQNQRTIAVGSVPKPSVSKTTATTKHEEKAKKMAKSGAVRKKDEHSAGGTIQAATTTTTVETKKSESTKKKPSQGKQESKGSNNKPQQTKPAPLSIADMFAAKQRSSDTAHDTGGDELQLVRLMMEGKVASANKGHGHRQRIRPRKKKFSTLKKHVLKERLRKWQESNPNNLKNGDTENQTNAEDSSSNNNTDGTAVKPSVSTTICILGFAEPDLLEDEDEYDELVSNLRDMAKEVAEYNSIFIPKQASQPENDKEPKSDSHTCPAFVRFVEARRADAAFSCWNGLTMGGQQLQVERVAGISDEQVNANDDSAVIEWEKQCADWFSARLDPSPQKPSAPAQVILENVLTEDDLEDDDCLEESLDDIRRMAEQYGAVGDVQANKETRSVVVSFEATGSSSDAAKRAAENLGKTIIGGSTIVARLQEAEERCCVLLKDVLSEEDLNEEECLEESLADIRELATNYGQVVSVELVQETSSVKIAFIGSDKIAQSAASGFKGMVIGGKQIEAVVLDVDDVEDVEDSANMQTPASEEHEVNKDKTESPTKPPSTDPEQMFSGEKLIGENWAECKRAPKIPNAAYPRTYATTVDDETTKPLLIELLGELMRLQKRAVEEDKNTKTKRRLVLGLREVARGIRTRKVKMVVMANNLDEYGVIDEKLQEILDLASQEFVPVFFEFSKRGLGKALGKTIKIAVVG